MSRPVGVAGGLVSGARESLPRSHRGGRRRRLCLPLGRRRRRASPSGRNRRHRPGDARAVGGGAHRPQGRPVRGGVGDHVWLADPGRLPASLRRHRRRQAARRGPRLPRPAQHGRVRHGQLDGEFRLPGHPQSVGSRAGARRIQRRLGCLRGRGGSPVGLGHRHGWVHPPTGVLVRGSRVETHLRGRQPVWSRRIRQLTRPDRALGPFRHRRRGLARHHRGTRPPRLHQHRPAGTYPPADGDRSHGHALRHRHRVPGRRVRAGRQAGVRRHRGRGDRARWTVPGSESAFRGEGHRGLLHHRAGGGQLQPGPLRRGPLRPPHAPTATICSRCTRAPAARGSEPR